MASYWEWGFIVELSPRWSTFDSVRTRHGFGRDLQNHSTRTTHTPVDGCETFSQSGRGSQLCKWYVDHINWWVWRTPKPFNDPYTTPMAFNRAMVQLPSPLAPASIPNLTETNQHQHRQYQKDCDWPHLNSFFFSPGFSKRKSGFFTPYDRTRLLTICCRTVGHPHPHSLTDLVCFEASLGLGPGFLMKAMVPGTSRFALLENQRCRKVSVAPSTEVFVESREGKILEQVQ